MIKKLPHFLYQKEKLLLTKLSTSIFIIFLFISLNSFAQTIINIPVITTEADSGDDAEERITDGVMDLGSSDLEFCRDDGDSAGVNQLVGIRFQNVPVPSGSTITNAYIQFKVDEATSGVVSIDIVGIDVDNAVQFNSDAYNISQRIDGTISSSTTAITTWSPNNWSTVGDQDSDQRTSNITSIVQEIIDRGGWNSGNSIGFVFSPNSGAPNRRIAEDGDTSGDGPILHLEYTPPLGPEINITGNTHTIYDGDITPNNLDNTYFESSAIGSAIVKTFTIQNTGNQVLNVSSIVSDNVNFSLSSSGPFTIAAGSSQAFTLTFNPSFLGRDTATINVLSDDTTESTYNFNVLGEIAIPKNMTLNGHWKYLDNGTDLGTTWKNLGFDDSSWASGDGQLGFGDEDEATIVADNNQITTYFRKSIIANATDVAFDLMKLDLIYDDGAVVYVNGAEVFRVNMGLGVISYGTVSASTSNDNSVASIVIANALVVGVNDIAVEIHQASATSSDVSFNFKLNLRNEVVSAGGLWHYLDDGSDQGTAWQTDSVLFSTWASGNAELGFGDGDEVTTVNDNNQITTYFRKSINVSAVDAANTTLVIEAKRDDGIIIYVNGVEVLRNNMPTGNIAHNTTAFGDVTSGTNDFENFWNVFKVDNILVSGNNEIAVEIHQYLAPAEDDLSFDLILYTNNDFSVVPTIKPDRDLDGVEDYLDADDDNDALPDIVEGCYTTNPELLNIDDGDGDGENSILSGLITAPYLSTLLDDGNTITYSVDTESNFDDIKSYDAGEHGFGLRVHSPSYGNLTLEFTTAVDNLFFKLIDFDENETWTIDVYDDSGSIVNLTTEKGIYHLGDYIEYTGNNTISDIYASNAPNANNPENRADDIYSAAYFYFPAIKVKKVVFGIHQPGGTIRIAGVQYCSLDTDGDGVDDFYDSDSDNDGIPDIVEGGGTDTDGDGKVDTFIDRDGDGVSEPYDSDPDTYYIYEAGKLLALDFDYDGILNRVDLDSDNDGILDIIEVGEDDIDKDGQIDGFTDVDININGDSDGYHDAFDGAGSLLITGPDGDGDGFPDTYPNKNTDGTLYPDFRDVDSDDDGITDHTEAQATAVTFINYTIGDTDKDGILDVFEVVGSINNFGGPGLVPVDSDGDLIPDYLDLDSDNHGELDVIEGHDSNGDGIIDPSDQGSCLTSITAFTGKKTGLDIDEDGLDDGFDNNISKTAVNYNPTNGGIEPMLLPNIDDIATQERDWREPDLEYNVIDFDGFNDYIDFADKHNLTSSFTIETWIKQDATSTGNGMLVSKTDCNKGLNIGYRFGLIGNHPTIKWFDSSGNLVGDLTSTHAIGTDRWYHLATVYDDVSDTVKIYIDGVETGASNTALSSPVSTEEPFLIGAKFDDTNLSQKLSNEFKGWIDEVRVWTKALTVEQMHMMMNQEIEQNGTAVKGKIIPVDIPNLLWEDLSGYYPMNEILNGNLIDQSSKGANGRIRNITTVEPQTAPLPYTTKSGGDGNWNSATSWTHGESVWDIPNLLGVDGTDIDWNIVQTTNNITINRNVTLLGLVINETSEIKVSGATTSSGKGTGNMLWLTHYLELDGVLDLDGESQLVQQKYSTTQVSESILDQDSGGYLDRDQQGSANSFNYNYWTSIVGQITPSGIGQRGSGISSTNNSFSINNQLFDGRDVLNPTAISDFNTSPYYADEVPSGALKISSYWFWKFYGADDDYDSWIKINENTALLAGEGFTMKGSLGGKQNDVPITENQNYVFRGKPYNGNIILPIDNSTEEVDRLIGNPYPSALDANEFIKDHLKTTVTFNGVIGTNSVNVFNGALYFWDHFGEQNTHVLSEYVGGYATYTLMGGVGAISNDARINTSSGLTSTKIPGRYIPVGQAFFVITAIDYKADGVTPENGTLPTVDGGDIIFKNSQRVFQKEDTGVSVFMKSEKGKESVTSKQVETIDIRSKIRLLYSSPEGYHRQLLIGIDENTTNRFDIGYDAPIADIAKEDMYWLIQDSKFVIQGVPNFNEDQEFPIGLKVSEAGLVSIKIDSLENLDNSTNIYLKDALTGTTKQINNAPFEVMLDAGTYSDRFSLTFAPQNALGVEEDVLEQGLQVFMNNSTAEIHITNNIQAEITAVILYNSLGQLQYTWNKNLQNQNITLPINNKATGMYIVQIEADLGTTSKKLVLQ